MDVMRRHALQPKLKIEERIEDFWRCRNEEAGKVLLFADDTSITKVRDIVLIGVVWKQVFANVVTFEV